MIKNEIDREVGKNDFSDCVKTYYQDLKRYHPISKEKERELLSLAKDGDIDARNQIINANLRFDFDIAKKYRNHGVDISDLISAGNRGMFKAIDKFDLSQDVKFFSYAVWWIRQHMMKEIEIQKERDNTESSFDDVFPSDNSHQDNIYCEDENEDYYVNDVSEGDADFYEMNEEQEQKHFVVEKLLARLDDRERIVISKYFGIEDDSDGHNLDEISKDLNLSTERVRQLKVKAINRMRAEVFDIKEAEFLFRQIFINDQNYNKIRNNGSEIKFKTKGH